MLMVIRSWWPEANWRRTLKVDNEDARRRLVRFFFTLNTDSITFAGTVHRREDQLTPAFWSAEPADRHHGFKEAVSYGNILKLKYDSINPTSIF